MALAVTGFTWASISLARNEKAIGNVVTMVVCVLIFIWDLP